MKKILSIVAIVLVLIIFAIITSPDNNKIKIGIIAPLTGGSAGYGEAFVAGVKMAISDLGFKANKYEFIFEDDESTPAKSTSGAQKLINIDKVQAIISATSGTGNGVKPIATVAGITHICICSDIRLADNISNFTYLPLPNVEAKAWVDEAVSRNIKTLAIISQQQPGMNLIMDYMKPYLQEKGVRVLVEERYDPALKDFRTILAKVKSVNPDLVLVGGFPPSLDILASQIKDFGLKNISGIAGTFAISKQPENLNSYWYADGKLSDPSFKERFEKNNPKIKFNVRMAPYGYDVINIINNGFESGTDLSKYISTLTNYNGKVGNVTKKIDTGSFEAPVGIWQIIDGKPSIVK